jgi:hypothetical protein
MKLVSPLSLGLDVSELHCRWWLLAAAAQVEGPSGGSRRCERSHPQNQLQAPALLRSWSKKVTALAPLPDLD